MSPNPICLELVATNEYRSVTNALVITIEQPRQLTDILWACATSVGILHPPPINPIDVFGASSWEALQLAMFYVHTTLKDHEKRGVVYLYKNGAPVVVDKLIGAPFTA